jgi:hypothetical protein
MIRPEPHPPRAGTLPAQRPSQRALAWLAARPAWTWRCLAVAVVTLLSAVALFQASVVVNGTRYFWLDDDQMISMRYARNLAAGHGLVWNSGQYVEGFSNLLWTLIMAAVHLLPLGDAHAAVAVKLINWGLLCAVLLLGERLLRCFLPKPGLALAALLAALAIDLDVVYWSVNGFETTLLTALFLLVLVRVLEEWQRGASRPSTYLLMGVLPLVRADAYYVWAAAALLAWGLASQRRQTAWLLALSLLPGAAQLLWRHWYYGGWLPNTYYLKVAGVPGRGRLALLYLARFARHYCVPLGFALSGLLLRRDRARGLLAAGFAVAALYVLVVGEDVFLYSRFLAHLVPVLLVLAVVAIAEATRQRLGLQAAALLALCVGVLAMVGTTSVDLLVDHNGLPPSGAVTGVLIRQFTRPQATIAVVAAGNVAYFSRRYAIDMLGKSDAHIAREPAHPGGYIGHDKFDPAYSLGLAPDLVVPFWPHRLVTDAAAVARAARGGEAYIAAIVGSRAFRRAYLPHPVPVPYLLAHNAVYVRADSPELARLGGWRAPLLGDP